MLTISVRLVPKVIKTLKVKSKSSHGLDFGFRFFKSKVEVFRRAGYIKRPHRRLKTAKLTSLTMLKTMNFSEFSLSSKQEIETEIELSG